ILNGFLKYRLYINARRLCRRRGRKGKEKRDGRNAYGRFHRILMLPECFEFRRQACLTIFAESEDILGNYLAPKILCQKEIGLTYLLSVVWFRSVYPRSYFSKSPLRLVRLQLFCRSLLRAPFLHRRRSGRLVGRHWRFAQMFRVPSHAKCPWWKLLRAYLGSIRYWSYCPEDFLFSGPSEPYTLWL